MKTLVPGETVEAEFVAATYGGLSAVDSVSSNAIVEGTER